MAEEGIQVPFEMETGDSLVTIEKLAAKILDLEDATRKLTEATKDSSESSKKNAVSFGVIAGAVQAITTQITGRALKAFDDFAAGMERSIAFGSKFQNMSLQFNTSAESLQKLAAVGKPVGVSVEQIARSLNIVERTLGSNQKAFQKWGIDVKQLAGQDAAGKFDLLIDKIRKIDDPAKQAAASFELLKDRSGAFLKIARSNDAKQIAQDFRDFGLAVSNNAVGALDALGNKRDLIHDIFESMKTNLLGAVASSGAFQEGIRIVIEVIGKLSKFVQENADTLRKWADQGILLAADAIVFLARNAIPLAIDGLALLAFALNGIRSGFEVVAAAAKLASDQIKNPFSTEPLLKFGKELDRIAFSSFNASGAILKTRDAALQLGEKAAAELAKLRDRIAGAAGKAGEFAAELKKGTASAVENAKATESGIKQVIKGLEDELALFAKIQALEKLGNTFASQEQQQVRAAEAARASAEKELAIRTQILEKQRELLKLKGDDGKSIDQQLDTLRKTYDINVKIADKQKEIAKIAASDARKVESLTNAKKLFDLQEQLTAAQNSSLTGLIAINVQHDSELRKLEAEFQTRRDILQVTIERRQAEGHDTSDLERQLAQLDREHAIRSNILKTTHGQAERMAKLRIEAEKVNAAFELAAKAAALFAGTDLGDFIGGLISATQEAYNLGQGIKEAIAAAGGFGNLSITDKLKAVASGLQVANSIFQKNRQELNGAKGAASGAAQGAAFGAAFGPAGIAIGAIAGGLIGFFAGSKFRKIAKDAGKVLGEGLSKETIAKIQEDSKKLGISIKQAALLNISTAIADTGKAASTFGPQILDLMKGIADGSIPAKEGIAEVGNTFNAVAAEALEAGRVGDRVMVGLIKRARELKLESPDIKAFVGQQLDASTAGVGKFIESLKSISVEAAGKIGVDAGIIFGANFNALVEERGIVAAVDAMQDSFASLKETLTKSLGEQGAASILAPFAAAFDTIGNEKLRPIFEGIDGITQALKGLANAGFLTVDQFSAMQHATKTLFDEAIAGGANTKVALQAIAPSIQAAIRAAEQFGVPLDADTQRLKELAEQNGITFSTDPQQAMLDVLVEIAKVLGADIPESAKRAERAIRDMADVSGGGVGDGFTPEGFGTGGAGLNGGVNGRKSVTANVTVNLALNENPLAAADTAAHMRKQTVEWVADAMQDRIPSIVAALEANG